MAPDQLAIRAFRVGQLHSCSIVSRFDASIWTLDGVLATATYISEGEKKKIGKKTGDKKGGSRTRGGRA